MRRVTRVFGTDCRGQLHGTQANRCKRSNPVSARVSLTPHQWLTKEIYQRRSTSSLLIPSNSLSRASFTMVSLEQQWLLMFWVDLSEQGKNMPENIYWWIYLQAIGRNICAICFFNTFVATSSVAKMFHVIRLESICSARALGQIMLTCNTPLSRVKKISLQSGLSSWYSFSRTMEGNLKLWHCDSIHIHLKLTMQRWL